MFPTLFAASAFGICNLTARIFTIFAPLVAEIPAPLPMIIFTTLAALSAAFAYFLND